MDTYPAITSSEGTIRGRYLMIATWAFIGVCLFILLPVHNVYLPTAISVVLLILVGIFPLLRTVFITKDYFEIINLFVAWFVMSIGIKGVMLLNAKSAYLTGYSLESGRYQMTFFWVFLYSIIGLVSLYAGYYGKMAPAIASQMPKLQVFLYSARKMRTIMVFFVLVGACGLYALFIKCGGMAILRNPGLVLAQGILQGGRLYLSLFVDFAPIGFLALYIFRYGRRFTITEFVLMATFGLLIIGQFIFVPMKSPIITVVLWLVMVGYYLSGKHHLLRKIVIILAMAALFFPLAQAYRGHGPSHLKKSLKQFSIPTIFVDVTVNRSAGADMFFLILDKTPDPNPFQYGRTLSKIFISFVPRFMWPDKPWSFGVEFNKEYVQIPELIASVSPSTIGELYVNFHLPGVIAGFFLIGVLLRTVYCYCIERGATKTSCLIYAIIAGNFMFMVDGPVNEFVTFTLIKLFPVFILFCMSSILGSLRVPTRGLSVA